MSPDGRWLVFTRTDGPQVGQPSDASLSLRDLRTGAERVLVPRLGGARPLPFVLWSSDSRRLAVSRLTTDATTSRRSIMVIDIANAGSQPIRFASVSAPRQAAAARFPEPMTWSSDGRQLAYLATTDSGAHEGRIFDASTGSGRALAPIQPNFESTRSAGPY